MTDLRSQILDIPLSRATEAAPPDAPGPAAPWIDAAAVLVHFDPLTLNSRSGLAEATSDAMSALLDASVPAQAERRLRRLRSGLRRKALCGLGTAAAMRAQIAFNPPPDSPTQRAFAALLDEAAGAGAILAREDPVELAGLAEAMTWVEGILPALPSSETVAAALSRARMVAPLRRLVGEHFAGRADVLAEIARHLDFAPPDEILMLQGPGGVGKSTVLAKFILDALDDPGHAPTVILLNLDTPGISVDDPFTLLQEAGRQLRVQHPDLNARLDEMAQYIASLQRRSRSQVALESVSGGAIDWSLISSLAAEVTGMIPGSQPILLVIDTFEEAQFVGRSAVDRLMQLVGSLQQGNPRLRVVIAGRVEERLGNERALTIPALDRDAAREVLEKVSGIAALPPGVAEAIFAVTEGNPLATHLAARVLAAEGAGVLAPGTDLTRLLGRVRTEQVQARLYGRLLGHIHDESVRKLAYPGLILRRITPALIHQVLAAPCGVTVTDEDMAADLFEDMRREVALLETDPGDGSLRHRADVRRAMLDDLRAEQPAVTQAIDRAAVAFYRAQTGPVARAEELYHMMALGAPTPELDARWEPGVEPLLAPALAELPARARVWLSNRLHLDLAPDLLAEAGQEEWETGTEHSARALLRDNLPAAALDILNSRADRRRGSPLYLTEAEALQQLGRAEDALRIVGMGRADAESAGNRALQAQLLLLSALIHEGARAWTAASGDAVAALQTARDIRDDMLTLRALVQLLRLHRKGRGLAGPAPADLVKEAEALLVRLGDVALFDKPGLLRELAAEIGARNPRLLASALSVTGAYVDLPQDLRDRVKGDLTAAIEDPRARDLAGQLGLDKDSQTPARLNVMALIRAASAPEARFAATALATDLMTAEIDARNGGLAAVSMADMPLIWRRSEAGPEDQVWAVATQRAF
ncbi:MAG: AAA family ATPase [Paracoccaceae bacterium]